MEHDGRGHIGNIPANLEASEAAATNPAPATAIVLAPSDAVLPALFAPTPQAAERVFEFFTAQIHNDHTRQAYFVALRRFDQWCSACGLRELAQVKPFHIAAFIKELQRPKTPAGKSLSPPTVKQNLAALRSLFDWLVTGHIIEVNPAHAVRGPRHVVRKGKTSYLTSEEARALLDSIDTSTLIGLRDRALIATMTYTLARVSAAVAMKVRDYYVLGRRGRVRLHEKGGKEHEVPCHHNLEQYLDEYIAAAGIVDDADGPLFRSAPGKIGMPLQRKPMSRQDSFRMIQRRVKASGIATLRLGNHSLRATGITAFMANKGTLEGAQNLANHASPRTTKLYDHSADDITQDDVEKISI
jgi:site-specific recombinase XerD